MISERQRIEAPPTPSVDNSMPTSPPPPSYEEANGVYAAQSHNGTTDSMGYFLGEVCQIYRRIRLLISLIVTTQVTNYLSLCIMFTLFAGNVSIPCCF